MNIEETDTTVRVSVNGQSLKYSKEEWSDEKTLLTSEGALKLPEWKIDLFKKHGADLDEL